MSNKSKIKSLEKKVNQLANQISLQKNKERFLEKKRKTSLGKIFIMAGARKFLDSESKPFNFVIALGGLFYIADMQDRKLSVLLGACNFVFENIKDDAEELKNIATVGDNFYYQHLQLKKLQEETKKQKEEKLEYPLNFFLGIMVNAKNLLNSDENIAQCHSIGDKMFIDIKTKKMENYKNNLTNKNINS